jgi:hypothetical protein
MTSPHCDSPCYVGGREKHDGDRELVARGNIQPRWTSVIQPSPLHMPFTRPHPCALTNSIRNQRMDLRCTSNSTTTTRHSMSARHIAYHTAQHVSTPAFVPSSLTGQTIHSSELAPPQSNRLGEQGRQGDTYFFCVSSHHHNVQQPPVSSMKPYVCFKACCTYCTARAVCCLSGCRLARVVWRVSCGVCRVACGVWRLA